MHGPKERVVGMAFFVPKGMIVQSYKPKFVVKAYFFAYF
jgi:hypothetical protein